MTKINQDKYMRFLRTIINYLINTKGKKTIQNTGLLFGFFINTLLFIFIHIDSFFVAFSDKLFN